MTAGINYVDPRDGRARQRASATTSAARRRRNRPRARRARSAGSRRRADAPCARTRRPGGARRGSRSRAEAGLDTIECLQGAILPMLKRLIIFAVLVTTFIPPAEAQTAATISGVVVDQTGIPLPAVTVTAKNAATGLTRTVTTGPGGRYVIAQLPPGEYELRAELGGFKPHVRPDVQLTVAQSVTLNITLQVGDVAIVEVVTGKTPIVNTSSSELSYLVTS